MPYSAYKYFKIPQVDYNNFSKFKILMPNAADNNSQMPNSALISHLHVDLRNGRMAHATRL